MNKWMIKITLPLCAVTKTIIIVKIIKIIVIIIIIK